MTKNLKPLKPYPVQINRVIAGEIGSGFFIWKIDTQRVEVVEFFINEQGDILNKENGEPLEYDCYPCGSDKFRYRIIKEKVEDEGRIINSTGVCPEDS